MKASYILDCFTQRLEHIRVCFSRDLPQFIFADAQFGRLHGTAIELRRVIDQRCIPATADCFNDCSDLAHQISVERDIAPSNPRQPGAQPFLITSLDDLNHGCPASVPDLSSDLMNWLITFAFSW